MIWPGVICYCMTNSGMELYYMAWNTIFLYGLLCYSFALRCHIIWYRIVSCDMVWYLLV